MIIDSTFIVDVLRNEKNAIRFLESKEESSLFQISAQSVFEIYQFIGKQKIDEFFIQMPIISVSFEIAKIAGEIQRMLKLKGQEIDNADCIIAATALSLKEAVITRNVKHFSRIPNLEIIEY